MNKKILLIIIIVILIVAFLVFKFVINTGSSVDVIKAFSKDQAKQLLTDSAASFGWDDPQIDEYDYKNTEGYEISMLSMASQTSYYKIGMSVFSGFPIDLIAQNLFPNQEEAEGVTKDNLLDKWCSQDAFNKKEKIQAGGEEGIAESKSKIVKINGEKFCYVVITLDGEVAGTAVRTFFNGDMDFSVEANGPGLEDAKDILKSVASNIK